MATWAIGDVHGCWRTLERLLGHLPETDRLWLVGDLVNRGSGSLEVLRWAAAAGERLTVVLGNHDLHLLARAEGVAPSRRNDTLDEVLAASDREPLLEWLARRPLLVHEDGWVLVHAGLWPWWSLREATCVAKEAEAGVRGLARREILAAYVACEQPVWRSDMSVVEREACGAAVLSSIRLVDDASRDGSDFSGSPQSAPPGYRPWFDLRPEHEDARFVFGHWAALGLHRGTRALGLDSGCVYGGTLSAVRLDDGKLVQEPCDPADRRAG